VLLRAEIELTLVPYLLFIAEKITLVGIAFKIDSASKNVVASYNNGFLQTIENDPLAFVSKCYIQKNLN